MVPKLRRRIIGTTIATIAENVFPYLLTGPGTGALHRIIIIDQGRHPAWPDKRSA